MQYNVQSQIQKVQEKRSRWFGHVMIYWEEKRTVRLAELHMVYI